MNRLAGQIFKGFNGNFATPFNTNSRSGPGTHFSAPVFNGNTQFGQISPMEVRTAGNRPVQNPKERARVQGEKNQALQVRLT